MAKPKKVKITKVDSRCSHLIKLGELYDVLSEKRDEYMIRQSGIVDAMPCFTRKDYVEIVEEDE